MNVATVAQRSPAKTKKCQAWRPSPEVSGFSRTSSSVKVSQLIVEPLVHRGVLRRVVGRRGVVRALRPTFGDNAEAHDAGDPEEIWKEPGDSIEPAVARGGEEALVAVLHDERIDDLIVVLARVDLGEQVSAHLYALAADALRERFVRAASTRAPDLFAHFPFQIAPGFANGTRKLDVLRERRTRSANEHQREQ